MRTSLWIGLSFAFRSIERKKRASSRLVWCKSCIAFMKAFYVLVIRSLNLHLIQTVLPDGDEGGDTILAVVEENNPMVGISV